MKKLIVIVIILIAHSACDEVKDLNTIDFNSTVEFPVNISESGTATNFQYGTSVVLDAAAADPEIQKYAGNIESIAVEDISFSITDLVTSIQDDIYLTSGSLGFAKKTASAATSSCSVDNLPISHWAGTGDFKIAACDNTLIGIGTALSADRSVKIFVAGTLTKTPLSFKLNVKLKLKVLARPI